MQGGPAINIIAAKALSFLKHLKLNLFFIKKCS
ncbi:MAG TPA: hypothetical protein ACYCC8_01785 [Candidatus Azoamicus sp.]